MWGEPGGKMEHYRVIIISTHSPRVGRTSTVRSRRSYRSISTHSPRVGRTPDCTSTSTTRDKFQLTRPVWGEPVKQIVTTPRVPISTHSPRVGRTLHRNIKLSIYIISTHSPRVGRTHRRLEIAVPHPISTHSPRVGRTPMLILPQ